MAVGKAIGWVEEGKSGEDGMDGGIYPMDFYEAGTPWAMSRSKALF